MGLLFDWFYSDPHFGHANIIGHASRPFSDVYQMNAELIRRYNDKVCDTDIVCWLGDAVWGSVKPMQDIIQALHGHKALVLGNHDKSVDTMISMGFELILPQGTLWSDDGLTFQLSHYPYADPYTKSELLSKPTKDYWLLHGHTHADMKVSSLTSLNLCVEAWDYNPVSVYQLRELLRETREKSSVR